MTLSKYAHMINSANLHDDLDVVTSVYLPDCKSNLLYIEEDNTFISMNIYGANLFDPLKIKLDYL